ncbi:MAG: hypothetical protein ACXITV_01170 [Luteibaculaceae bacterium]
MLAQAATEVGFTFAEGYIVSGFVDNGGYINFTGPNFNITRGNTQLVLGMMPSLRFKQDNTEPRNSFITPALGTGITFSYKWMAIQIPFYYNAKTATQNGRWHVGFGLGVRLEALPRKNKL